MKMAHGTVTFTPGFVALSIACTGFLALLLPLPHMRVKAALQEDLILFGTAFSTLVDPADSLPADLPGDVAARVRTMRQRAQAFHWVPPVISIPRGPEMALYGKRQGLVRGLVVIAQAENVEPLARDYAANAVLFYEWEGMSDGPLAEARHAASFLADHSNTALRPYLLLFLMHRYRCAFETLNRQGTEQARASAAAEYRKYLALASRESDPLVRYLASDIDRRPFLYLETRRHPGSTREAEPAPAANCPEEALPGLITDPRAWALACFKGSYGDAAAKPDSLITLRADLDNDGRPELFLGSIAAAGNAGSDFHVFKSDGKTYRHLGSVFMHPGAYKVQSPSAGAKQPVIVRYRRLGAGEGLLETVVYNGKRFVVTESRKVDPRGKDQQKLVELFGDAFRTDVKPPSAEPALPIERALALARDYIVKKNINMTGQHIRSVLLQYESGGPKRGNYWLIQWAWNEPRLGGEFGLRVYMDGTIAEARLGP